jgi:4-hydroxy 2-oxovalerate aldolase
MSNQSAHLDSSGKVNKVSLDCTLRDGGYYNDWNFPVEIINKYLAAMDAAGVNVVELGFRFWHNKGFKGASAFTKDEFVRRLEIPKALKVGVMLNAGDLVVDGSLSQKRLEALFPEAAGESPVGLVRIACHVYEFHIVLPASIWLKAQGYLVGFNLMQIADCTEDEVRQLAATAVEFPLDVLYFADSMGSMTPDQATQIISWLRSAWSGALGIHAHDNMGLAVANTLRAIDEGVTWVDSTVTGMGRGPGNAQTEYIVIELEKITGKKINLTPLLVLIRNYFGPMQSKYGWGKNPYYYLAGQLGIHPTYIQEMLNDPRYGEAEILSVIEHLRNGGGKKFNAEILDAGRQVYGGRPVGHWKPSEMIEGRDVLIVGAGAGVAEHREALEQFILMRKPFVIALNTQTNVDANLIDVRTACYPTRLLADYDKYSALPQPLIVPVTRLHEMALKTIGAVNQLDFGLEVRPDVFEFHTTAAVVPSSLVMAYALAIATSGKADRILLAGFDGYGADDARTSEVEGLLSIYQAADGALPILSITPTQYKISSASVYAL